jgi:RNA polymerase sigma factor (sigma-70 family)
VTGVERDDEERTWLASVASGGAPANAAMKALFQRYQSRFRAHLRARGFADADMEDVTQRVWMAVAGKAHAFKQTGVPEAWLWGFLKNEKQEALRRSGKEASRFSSANDDELIAPISGGALPNSPEATRAARDLRGCVDLAFADFKRRHGQVAWWMYLRHVEDWDLDQLARHRGCSRHAIEEFLSQARKLFRAYVRRCLELRAD